MLSANFSPVFRVREVSVKRFSLVFLAGLCAGGVVARAGEAASEWNTFRGDQGRHCSLKGEIGLPLAVEWRYDTGFRPIPVWQPARRNVAQRLDLHSAGDFDRSCYPILGNGRLYYAATPDDRLVCLDAKTGRHLWDFMAEGPIRLAPAYADESLFFGSDDGHLYCLDAATGRLKWKFRAGTGDRRLPGNGRIISRWPVRCGFVIDQGTVYFGAGVFPEQGAYVYALSADSGKLRWEQEVAFAPQGYMLANGKRLFVPSGRTPFHSMSMEDGGDIRKMGVVHVWGHVQPGGTFGVLLGGQLASGPSEDRSIDLFNESGKSVFRFHGEQLVARGNRAFVIQDGKVKAFDRSLFQEGEPPDGQGLDGQEAWSVSLPSASTLVLSDNAVFVACHRELVVLNPGDGKEMDRISIDDPIEDIVLGEGRVYLTTSSGRFYCLGAAGSGTPPAELKAESAGDSAGIPDADPDSVFSVLKGEKGYAFVLGLKDGAVLSRLLRDTDYQVVAADSDPERIDRLRRWLDRGAYAARIVFQHLEPNSPLPYQRHIANLVTSERDASDLAGLCSAGEVKRLARPAGGMVLLPLPPEAQGWQKALFPGQRIFQRGGRRYMEWSKPPVAGGGEWTHFYADPANTACSGDRLIKYGPLELQWYGNPGPARMVDRHGKNAASVYKNGRIFIPGRDYCYALDAYNGTILWEREVPDFSRVGAYFDSGNMVALEGSVLLASGGKCLECDARSGKLLRQHDVNKLAPEPRKMAWGYLASVDGLVVGTSECPGAAVRRYDIAGASKMVWGNRRPVVCGLSLFAVGRKGGKPRWVHRSPGKVVLNPTVSISDGRVVFVESRHALDYASGRAKLEDLLKDADLVALDLRSGRTLWRRHLKASRVTDVLYGSIADGVVLLTGSYARDTQPAERKGRKKPDQVRRIRYRIFAFDLKSGRPLWNREGAPMRDYDLRSAHGEAVQHPTIMNGVLYGPSFAMEVKTGKPYNGWKWAKSGNCAPKTASLNCVFGRSGNPLMFDLETGRQRKMTEVSRPGCWIGILPVGGLVLIPDADAGCTCEYAVQVSLALAPAEGGGDNDILGGGK